MSIVSDTALQCSKTLGARENTCGPTRCGHAVDTSLFPGCSLHLILERYSAGPLPSAPEGKVFVWRDAKAPSHEKKSGDKRVRRFCEQDCA